MDDLIESFIEAYKKTWERLSEFPDGEDISQCPFDGWTREDFTEALDDIEDLVREDIASQREYLMQTASQDALTLGIELTKKELKKRLKYWEKNTTYAIPSQIVISYFGRGRWCATYGYRGGAIEYLGWNEFFKLKEISSSSDTPVAEA